MRANIPALPIIMFKYLILGSQGQGQGDQFVPEVENCKLIILRGAKKPYFFATSFIQGVACENFRGANYYETKITEIAAICFKTSDQASSKASPAPRRL